MPQAIMGANPDLGPVGALIPSVVAGCVYNATAPALTSGWKNAEQCDSHNNQLTVNAYQGTTTVAISTSTATTTKIISNVSGEVTYISYAHLVAAAADNVTWEYGTGTNCGTGTTALSGPENYGANGGFTGGSGIAPIMVVPASQDTCLVTSTATQLSGTATYAQK